MKSVFLVCTVSALLKCICCNGSVNEEVAGRQWIYYPQTPGATSRDSYLKAAEHSNSINSIKGSDQGTPIQGDSSAYPYTFYQSAEPSSAYYYHIHPNTKPKYFGYMNGIANKESIPVTGTDLAENGLETGFFERPDEALPKTVDLSLAGIGGLIATAISGLSWFAIFGLVLILGPILVPLVLAPLILLGLIIYFIPVIQLNIPGDNNGRSLGISGRAIKTLKHLEGTARFVQMVAENEECIERISCEIARMARGNFFENWINKKLESFKNKWVSRVSRSFKAAINGSDCKMYTCNPSAQFKRVAQSLGGTT